MSGFHPLRLDQLPHIVGGWMDYGAELQKCGDDAACTQVVKDQMVADSLAMTNQVKAAQAELAAADGRVFNSLYGKDGTERREPLLTLPAR